MSQSRHVKMMKGPVRVLHSFPQKMGGGRVSLIAWQQVKGAAKSGATVAAPRAALLAPLPQEVEVRNTLSWNGLRLPHKILGSRLTYAIHDRIVARRLRRMGGQIDVVHVWPLGALETLKVAKKMGLPTLMERPNAHTRFAYDVVSRECERIGVPMPRGHEHAFNQTVLDREEAEYALASKLLCPSRFVQRTFEDEKYPAQKLARHQYGYDEKFFTPETSPRPADRPFTMLFAGGCAPRKGLHFALEAWLQSKASARGEFLIAGTFIPGYAERFSSMLSHPSVKLLGQRTDLPDIMRRCDVFTLPSIEEGSALVTSEARGSGCVLLVSDASGAVCEHEENALVHKAGDVATLREHLDALCDNPALLQKLRTSSLSTVGEITWQSAGRRLLEVYLQVVADHQPV